MNKAYLFILICLFSLAANASTIHWILFTDTKDPEIGPTAQIAEEYLQEMWIDRINVSLFDKGYSSRILSYKGYDVSPEQCKSVITSFECDSNDIVIFYYIGHGGRSKGDISNYPQLLLGQRKEEKCIPLTWVRDELSAKGARLSVTIGMCCNTIIEGLGPKEAIAFGNTKSNDSFGSKEVGNIQKLFLNTVGNIIVSSSSKDQSSWGCFVPKLGKSIDIFTYAMIDEFRSYVQTADEPSWHLFLKRVQSYVNNTTSAKYENSLLKQTPQFDIQVRYATTPQPISPTRQKDFIIEDDIKKQVVSKVGYLNSLISLIADKNQSMENRKYYRQEALKLFINNGEGYNEYLTQKDGTDSIAVRPGVMMEVTSVGRSTVKRYIFKEYLNNLANLKYDKVYIETTEATKIKVSNLHKIKNNLYTCTCFFKQAFIGYDKEGRVAYSDITTKRVECQVEVDYIPGESQPEYVIRLGDIKAIDTKPYKAHAI